MQITDEPPQQDSSTFAVDLHPERETMRVAPRGELDGTTAAMLEAQLHELRDSGFDCVVLDLRRLTFMGSAGIALILAEDRRARSNGHDFSLIAGPAAIQRVLDVAGVAGLVRSRAR